MSWALLSAGGKTQCIPCPQQAEIKSEGKRRQLYNQENQQGTAGSCPCEDSKMTTLTFWVLGPG